MTAPLDLPRAHRLREAAAAHPEWPLVPAAAAAWVFLTLRPHAHAAAPGAAQALTGTYLLGVAAMVAAMMLPLVLGSLREAAFSGPRPRRHLAMATFVAGYLAVWMAAMPLIDFAWRQLFAGRPDAAVGMMILAAFWELTPAKQRQRHGCDGGVRHGIGLLRSGVAAGGRCVRSCWALMAVCSASAHDPRVMAAILCIQLVARYRPATPPALTALAVLAVCLASLPLPAGVSPPSEAPRAPDARERSHPHPRGVPHVALLCCTVQTNPPADHRCLPASATSSPSPGASIT